MHRPLSKRETLNRKLGQSAVLRRTGEAWDNPHSQTETDRCIARFTVGAVCLAYGLGACDVFDRRARGREVTRARQISIYLMHTTLGISKSRIARAFGLHSTTVGHSCAQVEDSRECRVNERRLLALESIVRLAVEDFNIERE